MEGTGSLFAWQDAWNSKGWNFLSTEDRSWQWQTHYDRKYVLLQHGDVLQEHGCQRRPKWSKPQGEVTSMNDGGFGLNNNW